MVGFFIDPGNKKADLFDGGDRPFSVTTLPSIGQAVIGVLNHIEETKSMAVSVQNATMTQNLLLRIAENLTGGKL